MPRVRRDVVDAAGVEAFRVADVAHDVVGELHLQRSLVRRLVELIRRRIAVENPCAGKRIAVDMQDIGEGRLRRRDTWDERHRAG